MNEQSHLGANQGKFKRLNIRVDSSLRIGSGHVSRCIAIAEQAASFGNTVRFLFRNLHGSKTERMITREFEFLELLGDIEFEKYLVQIESPWPKDQQRMDAELVQQVLSPSETEVLLVDHYGLGETFSNHLRQGAGLENLYFIHDFETPNCSNACIHPGVSSPSELRTRILKEKEGLNQLASQSLVPFSKAIHNRAADKRPIGIPNRGSGMRVLVDFGTSEVAGLIEKIDKALPVVAKKFPINVTALKPRAHNSESSTDRIDNRFIPNDSYLEFDSQSTYLDFVESQDLVIGAGGVSCLERLYLGVPQIVFGISENQIALGDALADWDAIHWSGAISEYSSNDLSQEIVSAIENIGDLVRKASIGRLQLDGYGAHRIVHLILGSPKSALRVREVNASDSALLFGWANDPQLRRNSISKEIILPEQHIRWLNNVTESSNQAIYILERASIPLGQARFKKESENEFVLSYSIDAVYRGTGLAKELLKLSIAAHTAAFPRAIYKATIRKNNPASRAVLLSVGFVISGDEIDFEQMVRY